MSANLLLVLLRLAGASLVGLAIFHVVLWRAFDWGRELEGLSPLSARVFVVHTLYLVLVILGLGLLSLLRPGLLIVPGELARLLLGFIVVFWVARLVLQPLAFDSVIPAGWARHPVVRVGACLLWAGYAAVYGIALARQQGWGGP